MAIGKINKSDVRRELGNKTIDELNDVIAYHQQKAATNQRIVAIAKLMIKNKEAATNAVKTFYSSTDNAQPEQLSDSIDSENSV